MASSSSPPPPAPVSFSSCFDSGNGELVNVKTTHLTGGCIPNLRTIVDVKIRRDPYTDGTDYKSHAQWFHFKVSNVRGHDCTFRIVNAGACSYPKAFTGYWACCSYSPGEGSEWFRAPTTYDPAEGVLTVRLTPERDIVWCAYFAPFSYERHQRLIAACANAKGARVRSIGQTLDGRDIDLVEVGSGKLQAWVIARQHPGESMAEHWAAGFLRRLLDPHDALAAHLRSIATFHVVPNMNPDGSVRGYLRTNAGGANLNREWAGTTTRGRVKGTDNTTNNIAKDDDDTHYAAPTLARSPEVFCVLREMDASGVDFFVDVHGDEELPHNFFAGAQGVEKWRDRHAMLLAVLGTAYNRANPDFGDLRYNYGNDASGTANLAIASDQICQRFDCLSVTLEQPFKDCYSNQQSALGYSPQRCERLGAALLDAFAAVAPLLRTSDSSTLEAALAPATKVPDWTRPSYVSPDHIECSWQPPPPVSELSDNADTVKEDDDVEIFKEEDDVDTAALPPVPDLSRMTSAAANAARNSSSSIFSTSNSTSSAVDTSPRISRRSLGTSRLAAGRVRGHGHAAEAGTPKRGQSSGGGHVSIMFG